MNLNVLKAVKKKVAYSTRVVNYECKMLIKSNAALNFRTIIKF